jgi:DNA-binding response OmpR family regulator
MRRAGNGTVGSNPTLSAMARATASSVMFQSRNRSDPAKHGSERAVMLGSDAGSSKSSEQRLRQPADVSPHVLIVAVERQQELIERFRALGFDPRIAAPDAAAIWSASTLPASLVAVDCLSYGSTMLQWCRSFRSTVSTGQIPLVALTSNAQDALRVDLLAAGVDDCLFADVSSPESELRIRSLLRRASMPAQPQRELRYADIILDPVQLKVWRRGVRVHMTVLPFRLLQFLMMHPTQVFSRNELRHRVWQDSPIEDVTIVKCVSRLRRSLNLAGGGEVIRRTPNGYSLDVDCAHSPGI